MPSEQDDYASHAWPDEMLDLDLARKWMAGVLPEVARVRGPIAVYQAKEWGVTASFALTDSSGMHEYIFKAHGLWLFAGSARVAELLSRVCPGIVPELLAWEPKGEGNWSLFAAFDGQELGDEVGAGTLARIAKTLARIQVAVAGLPAAERGSLPRFPVRLIPEVYEKVVQDVQSRQWAFWTGEGRELAEQFNLPANLLDVLAEMRPFIAAWTEELLAQDWPESIDHVDLRPGNVAVKPDGGMLIFDWEEASISCPFFSLDRLLDDCNDDGAQSADDGQTLRVFGPAPVGRKTSLPYTPAERAVRDAYLSELPFGSFVEREHGFDLAQCLGPIKTAYEAIVLANALGWEEGSPHIIAWALSRALPRWRAMSHREGA